MENILVVGAHYDDVELGVGGSAAKFVKQGKKVYKLTLTDNVTRSGHLHMNIDYESSRDASAKASEILGIQEITDFVPVDCNNLFYNTETMQRIEDVIYKYNIDTVFMHFMEDANQDHVEASKLCKTASRHCQNVFVYQSNLYVLTEPYYPIFFVDISDFETQKIEALKQYDSQHDRFNDLFQATLARNKVWGASQKVKSAEAFMPLRVLIK